MIYYVGELIKIKRLSKIRTQRITVKLCNLYAGNSILSST